MTYSIIGTGSVGRTLASFFAKQTLQSLWQIPEAEMRSSRLPMNSAAK